MTLDPFVLRAALAGAGVAVAAAPLGCFVVWRRMAYFGDATAHGALLGVALALVSGLPILAGVLVACVAFALLLVRLTGPQLGGDTALGVLSHGALAVGLCAVALVPGGRTGLDALLFGDVLAVGWRDVAVIWLGAALVLGVLAWRWPRLLTATLGEDMARAAGIDPRRETLALTLTLAVAVAVGLQVVGALLVSAMLILPAAAARSLARGPETMAAAATALALLSVGGGITLSFAIDTPTGPSIVVAAAVIFAIARAR